MVEATGSWGQQQLMKEALNSNALRRRDTRTRIFFDEKKVVPERQVTPRLPVLTDACRGINGQSGARRTNVASVCQSKERSHDV